MRGAAALAAAALLAGCGSSDGGGGGSSSPAGQQGSVLQCARSHGLEARTIGDTEIQVGEPGKGPRIKFLLSTGAAESLQFKGGAQGAEQI